MKTIKQIADDMGIEKQRVYRHIKKHHINEAHQKAGMMYYDDVAERLIKQHFSNNDHINEAHQSTSKTTSSGTVDTLVDMLQNELHIKNQQIKELNTRLAETTSALVTAQQSLQTAQLLHGGTIQKQLTDDVVEVATSEETKEPKRGFLKRLFSK